MHCVVLSSWRRGAREFLYATFRRHPAPCGFEREPPQSRTRTLVDIPHDEMDTNAGLPEFLSAIASPLLRELAEHWTEVRGSRRMPAWRDIRPAKIKAQLTIIWSWNYDRARDRFTGRLAGERIQSAFGRSIRGEPMEEVFAGHDYPTFLERYRRIVCEPALFRGHGEVYRHLDRSDIGERIILPLADDGICGDGVIGATDFRSGYPGPVRGETCEWYSLD
jgi:hypothetical protein